MFSFEVERVWKYLKTFKYDDMHITITGSNVILKTESQRAQIPLLVEHSGMTAISKVIGMKVNHESDEFPTFGRTTFETKITVDGDVLAGAIIGGILGKALTGQDNGAAFGALAGAMTSAEKKKGGTSQQIIGHRVEQRCKTEYHNVQSQVVNQYRLTYNINGDHVTYIVNRAVGENSYIGQTKRFRVRYQLLN